MKKTSIIAIGALVVAGLFLSSVVLANVGNNEKNGFQVNGKHYNLNIIGAKNVGDIGDSMGHTMFVDLYGKTKIIMTQGDEFKVVDRCGVDEKPAETEFMIAPGHYNVYARALGKPGGKVNITANGKFSDVDTGEKLILLGYVNINRTKGKPQSVNINELFYVDVTLSILDENDNIVTVVYEEYWVFDIDELLEYYWGYNNKGLKLLQVRFYGCTLDPTGTVDDYCRWGNGDPIDSRKTVISA
jgi:hypothetical protein